MGLREVPPIVTPKQYDRPKHSELMGLLAEWFYAWESDVITNVKMPDALHVRTAMVLLCAGLVEPVS